MAQSPVAGLAVLSARAHTELAESFKLPNADGAPIVGIVRDAPAQRRAFSQAIAFEPQVSR